jgi:hypothetical protein
MYWGVMCVLSAKTELINNAVSILKPTGKCDHITNGSGQFILLQCEFRHNMNQALVTALNFGIC